MDAPEIYQVLASAGVVLTVDGDRLKVTAPAGILTDEFRSDIRRHKTALIGLLSPTLLVSPGPGIIEAPRPVAATKGGLVQESRRRCLDCAYCERNQHSPGSGLAGCTKGHGSHWPRAHHCCPSFAATGTPYAGQY
jgi:hypothetical protein